MYVLPGVRSIPGLVKSPTQESSSSEYSPDDESAPESAICSTSHNKTTSTVLKVAIYVEASTKV